MKVSFDPNERIFTFTDIKGLYYKLQKRLYKWAFLGAVCSFALFGIRTPQYKVEASFKEGMEKGDSGIALRELLSGMSLGTQQPQAASFMKSYQVLKPLIQRMGLNVTFLRTGWVLPKIYRRYRDSMRAEWGLPLNDLDPFVFQNVWYDGQDALPLALRFLDADHFVVHSEDGKGELAQGVLGAEVELPEFQLKFTLLQAPQSLRTGTYYPFLIHPWLSAASGLRSSIKIVSDKINKSIYDITLFTRDRHLGTRLLNGLMEEYQKFLKREYDQLAKAQLAYLENKQDELCDRLGDLLNENAAYFAQNLEQSGFIDLEQESQSLLLPYQQMYNRSLMIEVQLARLDSIEKEGKPISLLEDGSLTSGVNQLFAQIQDLKQQRDLLDLSLCELSAASFQGRKEDLQAVREEKGALEQLLQEVDRGAEISALALDPALCQWARALTDPVEREDFAEYLENYARLLSVREKMLQERFFYGDSVPPELAGIDRETARTLFVEYNNRLDQVQAAIKRYTEFKKEVVKPYFELATLQSILTDPLSQKIIADATAIDLKLKDEKYTTTKEEKRYLQDMELQRKILADHLDQLLKVEDLNSSLIREKMKALQKISLDGINQQISVLHEQVNDSLKEHRRVLLKEKKLLEKKMEEIRCQATALPEKWRLEKWLQLKTEMANQMMTSMTEVVESKTMANHLHHVESKPLDYAITPSLPLSPHLRLVVFLGALAFPFFLFSLSLLRQIFIGFPASLEKLQALQLPQVGSLSSFCDGPAVEVPLGSDLEVLRKLALFTDKTKLVALISRNGPDYSYALAQNLSRTSIKSIVLRCDFQSKYKKEDTPGLLQIWKGEIAELPIRKGNGFDYITAGGYTPFGTEILQSPSFQQLLSLFVEKYDRVFLLLRTPLSSAEATAILSLCEKAIVTISGEKTEELTPFIHWAYHADNCRLTFITCS